MILSGFEIENWSCIKKLTVADLPPTGVVVLHGPNRTGKSSIVEALRACLTDYASSSTNQRLRSRFPRGSSSKPSVSVTFEVDGETYRIGKHFGTDRSELSVRTSSRDWRVLAEGSRNAHEKVLDLAGRSRSDRGLSQLLWLTQAEFRLPEPKAFDPDLQAKFRSVLGILQTPLDDRFIDRVKTRRAEWHDQRRKESGTRKYKESCKFVEYQIHLTELRKSLAEDDERFGAAEALLRQASDLEGRRFDLERQAAEERAAWERVSRERESSRARIASRRLATERADRAKQRLDAALVEQEDRDAAVKRLLEAERGEYPVRERAETAEARVRSLEEVVSKRKQRRGEIREQRGELRDRADRVNTRVQTIEAALKLDGSRESLRIASELQARSDEIKKWLEKAIADKQTLETLKRNRNQYHKLQAARDAASMVLNLSPLDGAGTARLSIDGSGFRLVAAGSTSHQVRRRAELDVPNWGRVEISRGSGIDDLGRIETELKRCDEEFASVVEPLGVSPNDPDALDELLRRNAEAALKKEELDKISIDLKKRAPKGLEPLRASVRSCEEASERVASGDSAASDGLPNDLDDLRALRDSLQEEIRAIEDSLNALEREIEREERDVDVARKEAGRAREDSARARAVVKARREELERKSTEERLAGQYEEAKRELSAAEAELTLTELTHEEQSVEERLAAAAEAVKAVERQIRENDETYHRIRGKLEGMEGLHGRRALSAARVDELERLADGVLLDMNAVDRLHDLFEECREKQIGALMGPIQNRILEWMHVLNIGDYKEVRFGDAFLPEALVRRDGTGEFAVSEESAGAQEQIGMLVRLALGSILTSPKSPEVAVLDDPLTHCDRGRLNAMRRILRFAAAGDDRLEPPVGPMQILIFTCHPEWFRDDEATVIDLEDPNVLKRTQIP